MDYETAKTAFNKRIDLLNEFKRTPRQYWIYFITPDVEQPISLTFPLAGLNEQALNEDYDTWHRLMDLASFLRANPEDRQPAYGFIETGHIPADEIDPLEIDPGDMIQTIVSHYYPDAETYEYPEGDFTYPPAALYE